MAEKKMTDWHRKVLCNFDNAWSATQDMRKQIIEAQRFVRVSGAQWEGSTNAGYSFDEGRFEHYPRFELNKIARECDRIIGEYRQNRISVKFRPKDDKASEALAEKMNGKFRADYQETSGGEACDNAFDDAVTGDSVVSACVPITKMKWIRVTSSDASVFFLFTTQRHASS